VRAEVAHCYGKNGQVSVDPEVIMKMMFLLFFDDVPSERELMKVITERLDYLWFLGYGLEDEIPDHSVLSKARAKRRRQLVFALGVKTAVTLRTSRKGRVVAQFADVNFWMNFKRDHESSPKSAGARAMPEMTSGTHCKQES
jgi:transposase